jgi:catechol 2,3-dioxygenase-like lactoylglutathione lyase family enzyme
MRARITMLTLGVDDLERSLTFYRDGLGFPTAGIVGRKFEHGAVAFFDRDSAPAERKTTDRRHSVDD